MRGGVGGDLSRSLLAVGGCEKEEEGVVVEETVQRVEEEKKEKRKRKPQQTDGRPSATRGVGQSEGGRRGKPRGGAAACPVHGQTFTREVFQRTICLFFLKNKTICRV